MRKICNLGVVLWVLRIFGALPVAQGRYKEMFSKVMVVLNIIIGVTFTVLPIYFMKYLDKHFAPIWIYMGIVWNFCKSLNKIFLIFNQSFIIHK